VEFILFKKILIYGLLTYTFIGFILLPLIVKPQLIKLTEENTNAKVSIDSIYFNPFLFKLKVSGIKLADINAVPLLSLESFYLDLELYSLFYGAAHVHALELDKLDINLVRNEDKSINLLKIMKQKKQTQQTEESNGTVALPRIILDSVKLRDSQVIFKDKTLSEPFDLGVRNIGLSIKDIDTAEKNSAKGKIRFYASLGDGGFLDLHSDITSYEPVKSHGELNFAANKLYTEWRYVKDMLNIEVADGKIALHTHYDFNAEDLNSTKIDDTTLQLTNLRLKPKGDAPDVLGLKELALGEMTILPFKRSVVVPNVLIDSLDVNVKRMPDKKIDWMEYVKVNLPKTEEKDQNSSKQSTSFYAVVKKLALKSSNIIFEDLAVNKHPINSINDININLYNIESRKKSWLSYDTTMKVNKKGMISTEGKLRHTPLRQEGNVTVKELSLKELTPYLQEKSYIAIEDGRLSVDIEEKYEKSKSKPDVNVQGSLYLNSLFINNTLENSLLFSMNEFAMKSFTLELMPERFYVDTIDINSFYIDAKIAKDKTLNFSKLVKKSTIVQKETKQKSNAAKGKFPVKIAKVNVAMGSAKFQDFSIPLKFKTDIHDLNGVIYSISTNPKEITILDIDGEIDKYGSTKLKGRLSTLDPKAYTDIDFNFKNLALHSLSGYSAEFAGYKIDSGKLFLDLGYDIVKSKLHGTNKVIIKNIKLGDEVDDENVTVLPLGFVIALLEDDEGVIDIDMPVEGNLEKPDFKYGRVVWNTFTNLITKAVTSPFKFLGSMLGLNAEELEYVEFESGKSIVSPMQREKLDKLAGIMQKRPKLLLEVSGVYDKKIDKEALQTQKLIAEVIKRSGVKNEKEHQSAMNVTMLEDICKEQKQEKKLVKLQQDLAQKYKDEQEYRLMYREALIKLAKSLMTVSKKELEDLAKKRASSIVSYLALEKKIAPKRLKIKKIKENSDGEKFVKVELELGVVN
jgi:hypothetical protein